jgi:hypothetical protein
VKRIALDGRTESSRDQAMDFAWSGMTLEGCLREEQLTIEGHLEAAAAARQQDGPSDPRRPPVEEFSHQTGGSIGVVSDDAELNFEFVQSVRRLGSHARTLRLSDGAERARVGIDEGRLIAELLGSGHRTLGA